MLQGNSPKCPRGSFYFWEKSSCSLLCLPPYKEGPVLSHSPPLQLAQGLSGSGSHMPNFQLSLSSAPSLPGFSTSSLFPSLGLQATRSLTVLLRPCLAGEGALTQLFPRSPAAGLAVVGLGLQLPWSLRWSQGPFCPEAIPLPSVFSVSSVLLVSYLHKRRAAFGCSLCSSVEWVAVSHRCRGKLTPLPPISPPSTLLFCLPF